jgi:short subunit dehydrogenase-like uncharacterized protein
VSNGKTHMLVLGAYGLAGRAIVERLAAQMSYPIVAAGRNSEKLNRVTDSLGSDSIQTLLLDATDAFALKDACANAAFAINAVGPFSRTGATIARTVIECGCPYLDCANEQRHYHNLKELDGLAREQGVPMITAAGAIPGISTLLTAHLLHRFPDATEATCCWAQFRHAYAESGLASMMGGILEAMERPLMVHCGNLTPLVIGNSVSDIELQKPFGRLRMMELPTIDTLTLADRFSLQELHTWFYLGDMPTWLLGIIRLLRPDRRAWAYKLVQTVMGHLNDKDTAKAIAAGVGPECLLHVSAKTGERTASSFMVFRDGAVATACLPVYIADAFLQGRISKTGLLTPLDVVPTEDLVELCSEALLQSDLQ